MLSRGRVVVTDRLHGAILAAQMGIPTVALDSSYGKVHASMVERLCDTGLVQVADGPDHAAALARDLLSDAD